ncbi:MAG: hypothetical protein QOH70_3508 [Blastocatellia bacterium]|jgi:hypothetical protein|nr:hypothetical protein [Blastocatellia bacterium]
MNKPATTFLAALTLLLALTTVIAQEKSKAWNEWSKKDAEKMLNDSPWAQTQIDTDTSQMFYSPTSDPRMSGVRSTSTTDSRIGQGATNQAVDVKFHVRFFSARPIRQALVRLMEIQQKPSPEIAQRLTNFAELESTNSIIVTVNYESNDQRSSGSIMQAFNSAATGTLKNTTYLERNDGKRLFLEEYVPPGKDGFGARFIFLRELDGQPFITKDIGDVRFHAEYSSGIKIDRRFKVADMIYQSGLEY